MSFMIIIYLLLSIGVGQTVQQQIDYRDTYLQNGSIRDAPLVKGDPRFPADYNPRREMLLAD